MEELYLDGILTSVSVLLVVGYHVYLWQCLKKKPEKTSMGIQWQGRTAWLEKTLRGRGGVSDSMQVVQTLRNNLTIIILRASISITVSISVAALANNAYKAATAQVLLFGIADPSISGGRMFVVKYAAAFVVSVSSFVCSSVGVGFLVDTCLLVGVGEGPIFHRRPTGSGHIQRLVDTGFALAFIGNRLMWVSFLVLLWFLGPIAVALCSLALVWGFSMMDFNLLPNHSNACNHY